MTKPINLRNREEVLTILINVKRQQERNTCRWINLVDCYRIGKALFYLHLAECNSEGNDRKIKYVMVRPDINFSESGEFDYIVGFDIRDYLTDIYYSKNFNDF